MTRLTKTYQHHFKQTLALSTLALVIPWQVGQAATLNVDMTADNGAATACTAAAGDCSLRGAIATATSGDTINFEPSIAGQTITLGGSTLTINKNLTIDGGSNNLTVSGNNTVIIFTINANGLSNVAIANLTLINGNSGSDGGAMSIGGGTGTPVLTVNLNNLTFDSNGNNGATGNGGAIFTVGDTTNATVNINNSVFTNNKVNNHGGAIYHYSGTMNITNSTFSGNTTNFANGAGTINNATGATMSINNSTLIGNSGWNVINGSGTTVVRNSIIQGSGNCGAACICWDSSNPASTNNLSQDGSCGGNTANPLLGALANNGGTVQTMAVGAGSPAIDAGNNATCASTDARGIPRSQGGATCDIGAYELAVNYTMTLATNGTGTGTVSSSGTPAGTSCGTNCLSYPSNTAVTLIATATSGSTFVAWNCTPAFTSGSPLTFNITCTATFDALISQTITFTLPTSATLGEAPLTLTATGGGSGNPVTFTSTTTSVCSVSSVSGTTLTIIGVGTCTVTADQAGNANYLAATQVSANLMVNSQPSPDINVRQGSTHIPTSGSFDVGPSGIGHHVHHTFTIDNFGNSDLILSGLPKIRVSGANAGEFSVDDTATTTPIAAGTNTTFILTFIPTNLGNKTVTLTIANNDQDEGNYTVTVTGTAEPHKNLQVTVVGSGQGTVTSKPDGVDCEVNGVCLMPVIDAPQWVYLTAVPAIGSIFTGWSGDPACQADGKVFVLADTACVATFELNSYTLTVEKNAPGATVTGEGINCPDTCQASYLYGTTVKLEASQAPLEWEFVGWGGSCDNQGQLTITHDSVCRAKYQEDSKIPNGIDGNGDGQNDAHQANVLSLADKVSGNYITLEANPECVIADGDTVLAETQPGHNSHYPAPQGLMYFDLQCSTATVTMYFHGLSKLRRNFKFRKFGPTLPGDVNTATSYEFPAQFGIKVVGGKPVVAATYTLIDGQLGDSTGVDGHIVDPGGIMLK